MNNIVSLAIDEKKLLVKLLAPFAPHLSEELWESLEEESSIFNSNWPNYDDSLIIDDTMTIAIQVNGKVRGNIEVDINIDKARILILAKQNKNVSKFIEGTTLIKEIYVPGKIVNFVIK